MIASGFYYTGHADKITCFHCGITLFNWDSSDDVDVEHKNILLTVNICSCVMKFKVIDDWLHCYKCNQTSEDTSIGHMYGK